MGVPMSSQVVSVIPLAFFTKMEENNERLVGSAIHTRNMWLCLQPLQPPWPLEPVRSLSSGLISFELVGEYFSRFFKPQNIHSS